MTDNRDVQTVMGLSEDELEIISSGTKPGPAAGSGLLKAPLAPIPPAPVSARFLPPVPPESNSSNSSHRLNIPPPRASSPSFPGLMAAQAGASSELAGQLLDGRYLVERILGEGGMGVVYAGTHRVIGKKVAIKVLKSDLARDPEILERFVQEAKAASSIGHENIIDISDFGQLEDGSTYFVMELLEGQSLGDAMASSGNPPMPSPMPVPRILHIAMQMANGLGAAHRAGITHRDLKPDNVMLVPRDGDRDFVKILDFGIAKVNSAKEKLTRAGQIFGTPHYMSPEQAAGLPTDTRTDVYSLGVILYEMASGRVPFDADNFMGILTQHMYKAPVSILALSPAGTSNVPPGLDAIVLKCMDKRREHRYATMEDLAADLMRLSNGAVPVAIPDRMARGSVVNTAPPWSGMPVPVPGLPPSSAKKTALVMGGSFLAVLALAGVTTVLLRNAPTAAGNAAPGSSTGGAVGVTVRDPQAISAPSVAASAASAASAGDTGAASTTSTKQVTVKVVPDSAKVSRNGAVLTAPYVFDVGPADSVALSAIAPGYKPLDITVDASNVAPVYKLTPAGSGGASAPRPVANPSSPAASPTAKPVAPSAKAKPKCSDEGADPWDCQK